MFGALTGREPRVTAWDRAAVAAIDRPGVEVLAVPRAGQPDLAAVVAAARPGRYKATVTAATAGREVVAGLSLLGLDDPWLEADVEAVVRSFLAQFVAPEAQFRVEVTDRVSCPKFHRDHVGVRLVTTYHGPATQYTAGGDDDAVHDAPPGGLLFLKGDRHPTAAGAVRHRSPPTAPGVRRLTVVVDHSPPGPDDAPAAAQAVECEDD